MADKLGGYSKTAQPVAAVDILDHLNGNAAADCRLIIANACDKIIGMLYNHSAEDATK